MPAARRDAAAWGVVTEYTDATGARRRLSRPTVERLLDALGADAPRPPRHSGPLVVTAGSRADLGTPAEVVLEDGTRLPAARPLPPRVPPGYHRLEPLDDRRPARPLIVTPARCPLPGRRRAGLAVQLYAARSAGSWGAGDLASARALGGWARRHGVDFLLLNPLHAPAPTLPQRDSPYSPSSRRFRTPLALHVEDLPGAAELGCELDPLAAAGRRLLADRLIDRDAVWRLLRPALERLAAADLARDPGALERYRAGQGPPLERFALWCALAERHGSAWSHWPEELRRPGAGRLALLATEHADRIRFHCWVQMQLDVQLAAAAAEVDLVTDLAVGVDPEGADAWTDAASLAAGMRVGAPPDFFNPGGQDWGLPPFNPWRLREQGYQPVIETLRSCLRHAAGLRVDHVMGLMRLWWVPVGDGPAAGGYVRYPGDDLLGILALEARRAGAFVVGEDLGTVDPAIRTALRRRGVLSYRLLWFEGRPPARFPVRALAAATTHDLPTVAGMWSGADAAAQAATGQAVDPDAHASLRRRALRLPGVRSGSRVAVVVDAVHAALGASPALLSVATLDDLLLVEERPNHPGTTDQWPNWRLALPRTVEEITSDPAVTRRLQRIRRR